MTGDKEKFLSLEEHRGGTVTMGNNGKCNIIGKGKVGTKIFSINRCTLC